MKKLSISLIFCILSLFAFAQQEHYDTHPKFPHQATEIEKQMLPYWYQHVRTSTPPSAPVTALSEFQPMGGVMIAYPLGIPVNFVAELSFLTQVKVLVYPASDSNTVKNYFISSGVNMDNISFWVINHDSYWTRDYGPWFIIDGNDEIGIIDFTYNRPQRVHDDVVLEAVVDLMGVERYDMPIVHTGGNYMVDGYGTAASTDLVLEENPNLSSADIQSITQEYLGIDNYMLLNDPLGEYIAHIDCWGKFLGVDKVLIGQVATSDSRYNDYEDVANTFANAFSPWGNHYHVYRVYTPGGYFSATPYTNSLILNDHVFVPTTGSQWDNQAIETYQQAMPGYNIVSIRQASSTPWENTDALHCRTHELADLGMLFIKHYPVLGEQDIPNSVTIDAEIKALSGQSLVDDSLLVFYRINNGNWLNSQLQSIGGANFQAQLTGFSAGDEVDYYIFAKDQSGRRECHPYIGAGDPHHFSIHSVGISDHVTAKDNITIYPNPCENICFVQSLYNNIVNIAIYDICGKLVFSDVANADKISFNVSNWNAGVYTISITDSKGNTTHKKFVKR